MLKFEWDIEKARSNLAKHNVAFQEATTVFNDDLLMVFEDTDHSIGEARLLAFGVSAMGTHIAVSYTERDDTIRDLHGE